MTYLLRAIRLLTVVIWVGGLLFFAFVLAPTAFSVLPSTHAAGTIVGATLRILNQVGSYCGYIFVLATLAVAYRVARRDRKLLFTQILLVWLMIGATLYVRYSIIPAMERDRVAAGGDVDAAPLDHPARLDFERLHSLSEKVEGSALFLGVAVVLLMAAEPADPTPNPA
jgi:uncharacterized membrane protein